MRGFKRTFREIYSARRLSHNKFCVVLIAVNVVYTGLNLLSPGLSRGPPGASSLSGTLPAQSVGDQGWLRTPHPRLEGIRGLSQGSLNPFAPCSSRASWNCQSEVEGRCTPASGLYQTPRFVHILSFGPCRLCDVSLVAG